jgi:hypothetical protein
MSGQNLINSDLKLPALFGVGMLKSSHLFGANSAPHFPVRPHHPEVANDGNHKQEGDGTSQDACRTIELDIGGQIGSVRLQTEVQHNQEGIQGRNEKRKQGRKYRGSDHDSKCECVIPWHVKHRDAVGLAEYRA